jgi:outer membrane protein assembly factor BamB
MWKTENAGTSPVVSEGMAFVYDPGGKLRVFDAMTGKPLATYECGDGHWNSPIVVDGKIILPTGSGRSGGTIEIFH